MQILGGGLIRFIQFLKIIDPLESIACLNFHRLLFLNLFGEWRFVDLIEILNVLHHLHGGLYLLARCFFEWDAIDVHLYRRLKVYLWDPHFLRHLTLLKFIDRKIGQKCTFTLFNSEFPMRVLCLIFQALCTDVHSLHTKVFDLVHGCSMPGSALLILYVDILLEIPL